MTSAIRRWLALVVLASHLGAGLAPSALAASPDGNPIDPGASVRVNGKESETVNGVSGVTVRSSPGAVHGTLYPDGTGGYIRYGEEGLIPPPRPSTVEAKELRLYAHELAAQLLRDQNMAPGGVTVVPGSFTDLSSGATSTFGKYLGEEVAYEIVYSGAAMREVRGSATLARAKGKKPASAPAQAVIAGTYTVSRDTVFVNARLVRTDGTVLSTASVAVPKTKVIRDLLSPYGDAGAVMPTMIGIRNACDPVSSVQPVPFAPAPKKKAVVRKARPKKVARPVECPPCPDASTVPPRSAAPAQAAPAAPLPSFPIVPNQGGAR